MSNIIPRPNIARKTTGRSYRATLGEQLREVSSLANMRHVVARDIRRQCVEPTEAISSTFTFSLFVNTQ